MTKFNPENKEVLTYGECLYPAMEITTEEDAEQYLNAYIEYLEKFKDTMTPGNTPKSVALVNIGYFAGYCDQKVYDRVMKLFKCKHPIFGDTYPTPEEAFNMGKNS